MVAGLLMCCRSLIIDDSSSERTSSSEGHVGWAQASSTPDLQASQLCVESVNKNDENTSGHRIKTRIADLHSPIFFLKLSWYIRPKKEGFWTSSFCLGFIYFYCKFFFQAFCLAQVSAFLVTLPISWCVRQNHSQHQNHLIPPNLV